MKEKIFEALASLGFIVEEMESEHYGFFYEGSLMLLIPQVEENFIYVTIPCIVSVDILTKDEVRSIMNRANYDLRYTKTFMPNGTDAWVAFEYEVLNENEDLEVRLTHIIQNLAISKKYIEKLANSVMKNHHKDNFEVANE